MCTKGGVCLAEDPASRTEISEWKQLYSLDNEVGLQKIWLFKAVAQLGLGWTLTFCSLLVQNCHSASRFPDLGRILWSQKGVKHVCCKMGKCVAALAEILCLLSVHIKILVRSYQGFFAVSMNLYLKSFRKYWKEIQQIDIGDRFKMWFVRLVGSVYKIHLRVCFCHLLSLNDKTQLTCQNVKVRWLHKQRRREKPYEIAQEWKQCKRKENFVFPYIFQHWLGSST